MNPTPASVTVSVVRDRASLARVVAPWEDLVRHAIEPNPLYEPAARISSAFWRGREAR
jgi:hypothetical protein